MAATRDPGQTSAKDVQVRARAAGLELDAERAGALVAVCTALSEADRRLGALPMGESSAAGPPWGSNEPDGGR